MAQANAGNFFFSADELHESIISLLGGPQRKSYRMLNEATFVNDGVSTGCRSPMMHSLCSLSRRLLGHT